MNNLLRHLRIADLELFITAMHLKSLSKAAITHHLSQSSASAAITRVESAFGKELCHHEKRQFRLTHEGAILLPKIEAWLRDFQDKIITNVERPIRVATTNAIARVTLSKILLHDIIDINLTRPDRAYNAVLKDEADLAIVPDNSIWKDVTCIELGSASFGLYSAQPNAAMAPILLPENQSEVLTFIQRWNNMYSQPLAIKARIPSWSLIADLCCNSSEIGFLPSFLAKKIGLHPVAWQPPISQFKMLALCNTTDAVITQRLNAIIAVCQEIFSA